MRYNRRISKTAANQSGRPIRWLKFIVGLFILSTMVCFFVSGYTPPGVFGEVLRHNQEFKIDASPLFYSEVENMADYENGVREMREQAGKSKYIIEQ